MPSGIPKSGHRRYTCLYCGKELLDHKVCILCKTESEDYRPSPDSDNRVFASALSDGFDMLQEDENILDLSCLF